MTPLAYTIGVILRIERNRILPYILVGLVMCRAIRDYLQRTGIKVGFKPAGGIRTAKDGVTWLCLMKEELGDEWLKVITRARCINH